MFIRGAVSYAGELVGLLLPKTTFPGRALPVMGVEVFCDGTHATLTVLLGPVESEAAAIVAADEEMVRLWSALLVELPDCLSRASPPARGDVELVEEPRPGVVTLSAARARGTVGDIFVAVTPGPDALSRVQGLAASSSWDPIANPAYERYAAALKERDSALQLVALYGAALEAIRPVTGREPRQDDLDDELGRRFGTKKLPAKGPDRCETPFTRARNRLLHPLDRGVRWEDAKAYAACQLSDFRRIVAALVQR